MGGDSASDYFTSASGANRGSMNTPPPSRQQTQSDDPSANLNEWSSAPGVLSPSNLGRTHPHTARENPQSHPRAQSFANLSSPYAVLAQGSSQVSPYPHSPLDPYLHPSTPPHTRVSTPASRATFVGAARPYVMNPPPLPMHMALPGRHPHSYLHSPNPTLTPFASNTPVPMTQTGYFMYTPSPHTPPTWQSPEGLSSNGYSYTPTSTAGGLGIGSPGYFVHRPSPHIHPPVGSPAQQNLSPPFTPQPPQPTIGYGSSPSPLYGPYLPHTNGHPTNLVNPVTMHPTYMAPVYSPAALEGSETQGTWWYMPPVTRPQAINNYEDHFTPTSHAYQPNPPGNHPDLNAAALVSQGEHTTESGPHPPSPSHQQSLGSPSLPPHSPRQSSSSFYPPFSQPDPTEPNVAYKPRSGRGDLDRGTARRSYYPNPPSFNSEWVMWVGNVPKDASHDELMDFFNRMPSAGAPRGTGHTGERDRGGSPSYHHDFPRRSGTSRPFSDAAPGSPVLANQNAAVSDSQSSQWSKPLVYGGVQSIFLIAHTNCAFVNFETAEHLHAAIQHFDGASLRPNAPRAVRLLCRVRDRQDDRKAGVGAQRGTGMHLKWIRQQMEEGTMFAEGMASSPRDQSSSESPAKGGPILGGAHQELARPKYTSHSSGSGSTNSSILQQFFPQRYFILKSLEQVSEHLFRIRYMRLTDPNLRIVRA